MGRTFEIISEIKVLEPAGNHREEEEEAEGQDEIDWGILTPSPYPSQDRPPKEEQNHAQNEEAGTDGQKFGKSEGTRENNDMKSCLKYLVEREKCSKQHANDNNPLS
ncbi:MAG TPA: hypothetical protein VE566_00990, partial [Nitrososphaeraceae archaeon]|nr:hypothetical protein [Nitrososphaeraceae archaeon]